MAFSRVVPTIIAVAILIVFVGRKLKVESLAKKQKKKQKKQQKKQQKRQASQSSTNTNTTNTSINTSTSSVKTHANRTRNELV
ncbi:hypothetical protein TWF718_006162 [Orbilia javanica]|uniref:Uncharacterized protein n=1 Tax=Orbilia javanica TaxID=47235 RepID=A0AAN8NY34_9PEZI